MKEPKELRQATIKNILEQSLIFTQEELTEALLNHGIKATQATISRDIKELMLVKTPLGDGRYRYTVPLEGRDMTRQRLERTFRDCLTFVEHSLNLVVLKTLPGMAQAVAHNIDCLNWPEILGTVAGDDTLFILVKSVDDAPSIAKKFRTLANKE